MNLRQMWSAANSPDQHRPAQWLRLPSTVELLDNMREIKGGIITPFNVPDNTQLFYTVRGRTGGTYAHWRVAVRYAEYLDSGMARYLKKAFPTINHNISGIHI